MSDTTTLALSAGISASNAITIAGTSTINVASGTGTLSGNIGGSGLLAKTGASILSLTGNSNYSGGTNLTAGTIALGSNTGLGTGTLAMSNTTTLVLSNGVSAANPITLTGTDTFNVAVGTAALGGNISNTGTFIKTGVGTLILSGMNSYSGGTTVSAGTLQGDAASLQGVIVNNASVIFNQTTAGTYSSTMSGSGSVTVEGGGLLTFSGLVTQNTATIANGGLLSVNGTLHAATTVSLGGSLQGVGIIQGNVSNYGTVSPGNSVGTLTILGNYVQETGSNLIIEFNPASADLLNVSGNVTILPGATITLTPTVGAYAPNQTYTVVSAGGLRSGQFSFVVLTLPSFSVRVVYPPNSVDIVINLVPFSDLGLDADALIVANCLDSASPADGSDLQTIIDDLRFMSVAQMQNTMHQMLPSLFNGLDLAQEATILQVRQTLTRQMDLLCKKPCGKSGRTRIWTDFFSTTSLQNSSGDKVGYKADFAGGVLGADQWWERDIYTGFAYGYTQDKLDWKQEGGSAWMENVYGALYAGGWMNSFFYAQSALIASYNFYKTHRKIAFIGNEFTPFTRTAKGRDAGYSLLSHFETGCIFGKSVQARPFERIDYAFVHRKAFEEQGADSIDLIVDSHNADLLRSETGAEFFTCFLRGSSKWTPSLTLSCIWESRFLGKKEQATLSSLQCWMQPKGLSPERLLLSWELGLMGQMLDDRLSVSGNYRGEWGKSYQDHTWSLQMKWSF
jgi:autotransporter-associated beta strand protein